MPTPQNQREFEELLTDNVSIDVPKNMLQKTIEWVRKNMEPDEVFEEKRLNEWATSNGYVRE
jgi:hypothetical protein